MIFSKDTQKKLQIPNKKDKVQEKPVWSCNFVKFGPQFLKFN